MLIHNHQIFAVIVSWGLCWSVAVADEVSDANLISQSYELMVGQTPYADQLELADRLYRRGVDRKDRGLEARGLMRKVFITIFEGQWNGDWENWRARAIELVSDLRQPDIAVIEVQGLNGFLDAMYFGKMQEGTEQLQAALVEAEMLDDDQVLIFGHYLLGLLLDMTDCEPEAHRSWMLSALLARKIGSPKLEYLSLHQSVGVMIGSNKQPHPAAIERLREIEKQLDIQSHYTKSRKDRLASQETEMERFFSCEDLPDDQATRQIQKSMMASIQLLSNAFKLEQWADADRILQVMEASSTKLKNTFVMRDAEFYRAGLNARNGDTKEAVRITQPFIEFKVKTNRKSDLNHLCRWMAEQLQTGGESEYANTCRELADQYDVNASFSQATALSAQATLDAIMCKRAFHKTLDAKNRTVLHLRWMLLIVSLGGLCLWFLHQRRQQHQAKAKLMRRIAETTATLQAAKEAAEEQNQAKSEFIARINHGLRTPMMAVIASSELILAAEFESDLDRNEAHQTLVASSQNLLEIVDDVIDLTRMESGNLTAVEQEFSPTRLIRSVTAIVRTQLRPGVELRENVDTRVPELIRADETKIRQILINVALHSAQLITTGWIELGCQPATDEEGAMKLAWTLKDSGSGNTTDPESCVLSPCDSRSGYDKLRQGMYVCHSYATFLGGTVKSTSTADNESDVRIVLPYKATTEAPPLPAESAPKPGRSDRKILVVDDEPLNRTLLKTILTKLNFQVEVAERWSDVEALLNGHRFDVVLLDLRMPGVDGFEALRRIKSANLAGTARVLAVTGYSTNERRTYVKDVGFDGFLAKPFTISQLRKAVDNPTHDAQSPSS